MRRLDSPACSRGRGPRANGGLDARACDERRIGEDSSSMGGWSRVLGAALPLLLLSACGGSEFSNDGATGGTDAGSDAAGGTSGGSGGAAGSGGQAGTDAGQDAAPNACQNNLFQKTCQDPAVTTGDSACDQCGRASCCSQTNACLADPSCAQQLYCYLQSCLGQSAFNCVPGACATCLASTGIFIGVSSCLQGQCSPQCPMLIP
jgi:hypothetical protein